jgi:hypothetical protein
MASRDDQNRLDKAKIIIKTLKNNLDNLGINLSSEQQTELTVLITNKLKQSPHLTNKQFEDLLQQQVTDQEINKLTKTMTDTINKRLKEFNILGLDDMISKASVAFNKQLTNGVKIEVANTKIMNIIDEKISDIKKKAETTGTKKGKAPATPTPPTPAPPAPAPAKPAPTTAILAVKK